MKHCSKLATSLPAADSKLIWSQAAKLRGGTAQSPKTPHSQGDKLTWKELLTPQDIPSFKAEIPWRPARGILLASHHQRGPGQSLAHRQQAFQSLLRTCRLLASPKSSFRPGVISWQVRSMVWARIVQHLVSTCHPCTFAQLLTSISCISVKAGQSMSKLFQGNRRLVFKTMNGRSVSLRRRPLSCLPHFAALGTVTGEQTSLLTDEPVVDPTYRT